MRKENEMKKDEKYYDERSAGGIVFKEEGKKILWLVIKTIARKGNRRNKKEIYKFPKGHLQRNEFLKGAALREVEEEGKIKAEILTKLGSNDYLIWDEKLRKKIIKKVTFFLMKFKERSNLRYFDDEVIIDREWLEFKEVMKKLEYPSEKRLLKRAKEKAEKYYR